MKLPIPAGVTPYNMLSKPIIDGASVRWYAMTGIWNGQMQQLVIRCNKDYTNPQVVDYGNREAGNGGPLWVEGKKLWVGWFTTEQPHVAEVPGYVHRKNT